MTHVISKLIDHIKQQAEQTDHAHNSIVYTNLYKQLLEGKDDYIKKHHDDINHYIERIERLKSELSQIEVFKQQLIITTDIMFNGEMVRCIDNYIANIQLRMDSLLNTLSHKESLDIDADYEIQLSLTKKMMETFLYNEERQILFNNEYLLVQDSLLGLQMKLFGRNLWNV